jgi:hypothetical protein
MDLFHEIQRIVLGTVVDHKDFKTGLLFHGFHDFLKLRDQKGDGFVFVIAGYDNGDLVHNNLRAA